MRYQSSVSCLPTPWQQRSRIQPIEPWMQVRSVRFSVTAHSAVHNGVLGVTQRELLSQRIRGTQSELYVCAYVSSLGSSASGTISGASLGTTCDRKKIVAEIVEGTREYRRRRTSDVGARVPRNTSGRQSGAFEEGRTMRGALLR